MSEFVKTLQAERAKLTQLSEAKELPAALERRRLAREEYRGVTESRGMVSTSLTEQERVLNQVATAANQVVADLERSQERARERITEIDRLLTASADAAQARKDLTKATASIAEARGRIDQLDQISGDLENDIAELTRKRATATEQQGRDDLAQRLAGKPAVPAKGVSAINADLESRRSTLAAAQAAKAEAEAPLATLLQEAAQARNRLRGALQRSAELSYYELLPSVLPVVARLMVLGSPICGYASLEIHCDDETLQGANAAIEKELQA